MPRFQLPQFNLADPFQAANVLRGQGLQNQLLQMRIEQQPQEMALREYEAGLRGGELGLRAAELEQKGATIEDKRQMRNFSLALLTVNSPEKWEALKAAYPENMAQIADAPYSPDLVERTRAWVDAQVGIKPERETKTNLEKYFDMLERYPPGTPQRAWVEAKIAKETMASGMEITQGPEGFTFRQGPGIAGGGAVSKPTGSKIEQDLIKSTKTSSKLRSVREMYKPEYQEIGTRLQAAWGGTKAFLGMKLPAKDQALVKDFAQYKRSAIRLLNDYIRDVTGAQLSEHEAKRIQSGFPNVGVHWWQGDDPITFKAAMDNVIRELDMATARYTWMLRNGLILDPRATSQQIELEDMPEIMAERAQEIYDSIKEAQPQADDNTIRQQVRTMLADEFGLAR